MPKYNYESDSEHFSADAYKVNGDRNLVAWYILGWHTEPDEDTEWSGYENRTGRVVCAMVGDDSHFLFDEDQLVPLTTDDYCGSCGQIGCGHG